MLLDDILDSDIPYRREDFSKMFAFFAGNNPDIADVLPQLEYGGRVLDGSVPVYFA